MRNVFHLKSKVLNNAERPLKEQWSVQAEVVNNVGKAKGTVRTELCDMLVRCLDAEEDMHLYVSLNIWTDTSRRELIIV